MTVQDKDIYCQSDHSDREMPEENGENNGIEAEILNPSKVKMHKYLEEIR